MIKKNDFVKLEYTGKIKETGEVFDTTSKAVAEKANIADKEAVYGPVIVCLGAGHLLAGLDEQLMGKTVGKYTFELDQEHGFGKKDAKLLKLISTSKFKKDGVRPMIGLRVNIDNQIGIIKTVTGGRTIVDFNHPLSGKNLLYEVNVINQITNPKEKIESVLKMELMVKEPNVKVEGLKATIKFKLPEDIQKPFKEIIMKVVPEIKEIVFVE